MSANNNKLDAINSFLASNNLINNNTSNLYKKEVLNQFKSEKTGREALRKKQLALSKHLLAMQEIKNDAKVNEAKKILIDFYKLILLDVNKFSNISKEKDEFKVIEKAHNIIKKDF